MKFLAKLAIYILIIFLTSFTHLILFNFLPFPIHLVNTVFLISIIFMIWRESGVVVWFSFFCHLILEFFTSSYFGILIFAGTFGILISYWLYKYIFTNRSWYAALALSFFSLLFFRFFYISLKILFEFLLNQSQINLNYIDLINIFWEIILTSFFVGLLYGIIFRFYKKFNPSSLY